MTINVSRRYSFFQCLSINTQRFDRHMYLHIYIYIVVFGYMSDAKKKPSPGHEYHDATGDCHPREIDYHRV